MAINLIKHKILENNESRHKDLIYELQDELGFDEEYLNSLTYMELSNIIHLISNYFGYSNFKLIKEFIDLNEKKLIENNDLTTYKTFNELELQISLSNLKNIDKEMTKQVQKLYETDEWLLVKPLSYQASLKYGASTKWCTASKDNAEYYFRYSKRGILIYSINKKTGKVIIEVDPKYFRPTEVELLIGDPSKAQRELGWKHKYSLNQLVSEMMKADVELFSRDQYLQAGGHKVMNYNE
jgi:hypothetical protein